MESFLDYEFQNSELLNVALTHSSYAHESKNYSIENNERFEFLGDAVLELVISDFIFHEFPELPEGELTKLRASVVCETALSKTARDIKLGNYLRLGRGEEHTGGRCRDSILADALEAVIGAIYLDGGIKSAEKFILDNMRDCVFEMRNSFKMNDCKTFLQEFIQKSSKEPIEYCIVDEYGPAHDKVFTVQAVHSRSILGVGEGKSKKEAEQNAAYNAIKKLNIKF